MNISTKAPSNKGFSLVEVTLAIGIVGMAILSLVGILGSTFQQVDEIMLTNRAVAGVTRLVGALDNPKSILWLNSTGTNLDYLTVQKKSVLDSPTAGSSSNFDIAYRIVNSSGWTAGNTANSTSNGVWLFVYERKMVGLDKEMTGTTYNISSNPSIMEVAACDGDDLNVFMASQRNIVGVPMRVRISVSKLLVGQPYSINSSTLEPDTTNKWLDTGLGKLNTDPNLYPLAYLPLVVEFFPHDYAKPEDFKKSQQTPILVQNIVISR